MQNLWLTRLIVLAAWLNFSGLQAANEPIYKTGFASIMALGRALYGRLDGPQQEWISPQPIVIDPDTKPFLKPFFAADEPKPQRGVTISVGFVDLVNRIAHAKAIDRIEKGYFEKYLKILAAETGETGLQDLPNDSNPAYWSDRMLDEQQSNFNSIVGSIVGIQMANHYLGNYEKYKTKITDKSSILNLLELKEWDKCVASGIYNALDAGCTIEGVIPFLEAFDRMTLRPVWSQFFIPDSVRFGKTKKQIEKIQSDFFAGKKR